MAKPKRTEKYYRDAKPGKGVRREYDDVQGLHLAITEKKHKTWYLSYTSPETAKRVPSYRIGTFLTADHKRDDKPITTLSDARDEVIRLRGMINKGVCPAEEKRRQEEASRAHEQGTFGNLLNLYVDSLRGRKAASADKVKSALDRVTDEALLSRPADPDKPGGITEDDVMLMMGRARKNAQKQGKTGDRSSDLIYSYIHRAYEFGRKASKQDKWKDRAAPFKRLLNPAADIERSQSSTIPSDNMLDKEEVVFIWNKAGVEALSLDLALYIKLALALGGQRVLELLHAEWKEFHEDEMSWAIPMARRKIRHRAKHREPHLVPLTAFSLDLLHQLHELSGRSKYLFPDRTGKKPRTPDALNQAIKRFCEPQGNSKREPFKHFSGRDLRRTWKTLAGQAGLSKEVRDRVQSHSFGDVASVHYDRHDYWPEKQVAMEKWCTWLDELVSGKRQKGKVVQLRGAS